jgi:hypothetical protein
LGPDLLRRVRPHVAGAAGRTEASPWTMSRRSCGRAPTRWRSSRRVRRPRSAAAARSYMERIRAVGRALRGERGARAGVAIGLGFLVFVAAVVTFWPGLSGDFLNWDDWDNVVNNPGVHGLGREQLVWMWTGAVLGHYIPLTWMSFGLNYVVGGLKPWGYHALNMLLHGATAVLFYLIARRPSALARPGVTEAGAWAIASAPPARPSSSPCTRSASSPWCGSRSARTSCADSFFSGPSSHISRRWPPPSSTDAGRWSRSCPSERPSSPRPRQCPCPPSSCCSTCIPCGGPAERPAGCA